MNTPDAGKPESQPPDPAMFGPDPEAGPARALTLHLLRMLETRMDAAGIAISSEVQSFGTRMQLKILAAALMFIAIWGGIVLLAIALPDPYRIPVLAAVVAAFVVGAIWASMAARNMVASTAVGSMRWFLDGLKQDLEVVSRSLHRRHEAEPASPTHTTHRSPPSDLAA